MQEIFLEELPCSRLPRRPWPCGPALWFSYLSVWGSGPRAVCPDWTVTVPEGTFFEACHRHIEVIRCQRLGLVSCSALRVTSVFVACRPQNGSMILYNRKKVKYRKDGYCWKKRKDGKTTREDHMKLKVQGVEVKGGEARAPGRCCRAAGVGLLGGVGCQPPLRGCCGRDPGCRERCSPLSPCRLRVRAAELPGAPLLGERCWRRGLRCTAERGAA